MERHCFRYVVVLYAVLLCVVNILSQAAGGRELRPSDHGLAYQNSSPPTKKKDVHDMLSFFGRSPPPPVEMPEARNFTGEWWKSDGGSVAVDVSRDGKKDNVMKKVLLVASLVCGASGVVLLAAAAFLVVRRLRKQRREPTASMSTSVPKVVVRK